jgi:NAD(P)H-quinone oxidoreductase subunit 5
MIPASLKLPLYRLFLERGHLDALLNELVVRPFVSVFRWCDAMERAWTDWLSGTSSRESDRVPPVTHPEELP